MCKILLMAMGLSLFISCATDNPEIIEYKFYKSSTIAIDTNDDYGFATTEAGQNLVFEYFFTAREEPNVADDEYSERIVFEIDASVESFSLSGDDLILANTFFDKYCFCELTGSIPISSGTITGEQLDADTWSIDIEVSFMDYQEEFRSISGNYSLSSL